MLKMHQSLNSITCRDLRSSGQNLGSVPRHSRHARAVSRSSASDRVPGPAKELVYFATFPLVGLERLEGALVFSGGQLPDILAQHCAIIVESGAYCTVFDFLPEEPTSPATAATLLSGGRVTGVTRQRAIRRIPRRRCNCLGPAAVENAVRVATEFNDGWNRKLQLFQNDCRTHTTQLARLLMADATLVL